MHEHGLTFSVLRRVISLTSKKDCECGLEELPNGLWVSLMTAILAVPMIGLLNIGFAWLRAPLTLDVMVKSGEVLDRFDVKEEHTKKQRKRGRACRRLWRWLAKQPSGVWSCIKVQTRCLRDAYRKYRSAGAQQVVTVQKVDPPPLGAEPGVPRRRAAASRRRKRIAAQMKVCEQSIDVIFHRMDADGSGGLNRKELRTLMQELDGSRRVDRKAVDFVFDNVPVNKNFEIELAHLKRAITMWRYVQAASAFIDSRFHEMDKGKGGDAVLTVEDVRKLLGALNEADERPQDDATRDTSRDPSPAEVEWAVKAASGVLTKETSEDAPIDRDALRAVIAVWFPAAGARRQPHELRPAEWHAVGQRRRYVAAQIGTHRHASSAALNQWKSNRHLAEHDWIGREELKELLRELNSGKHVPESAVQFVLRVADHHDTNHPHQRIEVSRIQEALAMWKSLHSQQKIIDEAFAKYDTDNSGTLDRHEVQHLLRDLNSDVETPTAARAAALKVPPHEIDWVIEAGDRDGSNTLDREELESAVAFWYLHVVQPPLGGVTDDKRLNIGWMSIRPWAFAFAVGLTCALMVRLVSAQWCEEKTQAWLGASVAGLVWKLLLIDPLKVLLCGALLEPIIACLYCDFSGEAVLETIEDVVETEAETFTGGAANDDLGQAANVAQELTRAAGNNAVFAVGSLGAAKFARKAATARAKLALKKEQELVAEDIENRRVRSNVHYSAKVAERRAKKGLTAGKFAEQAVGDVLERRKQNKGAFVSAEAELAAVEAEAEADRIKVEESVAAARQKSDARYAAKIAHKRQKAGKDKGSFAERAGVDGSGVAAKMGRRRLRTAAKKGVGIAQAMDFLKQHAPEELVLAPGTMDRALVDRALELRPPAPVEPEPASGSSGGSGSESAVATPPSNPSASLQTGNGPSHGRRAGQARVAAREAARAERREAEMQSAASQAADMIARMNAARRADQAVRAFGGTKKGDENA